eukprot:11407842-Prorocentrum_lima.AAC.1
MSHHHPNHLNLIVYHDTPTPALPQTIPLAIAGAIYAQQYTPAEFQRLYPNGYASQHHGPPHLTAPQTTIESTTASTTALITHYYH